MIGDIGVIRTFCNPWPKDNPKMYYAKYWEEKFDDELCDYYHRHDFDLADNRRHIHVFFDSSGTLKITQCEDPELYSRLYRYIKNLYDYELRNSKDIQHCNYNISTMLTPYITSLKNGFRQVRYKDFVINLSPEQYSKTESMYAVCHRTSCSTIIEIDSGIPRFDDMIRRMILNGDIFLISGCIDNTSEEFRSIFQ